MSTLDIVQWILLFAIVIVIGFMIKMLSQKEAKAQYTPTKCKCCGGTGYERFTHLI